VTYSVGNGHRNRWTFLWDTWKIPGMWSWRLKVPLYSVMIVYLFNTFITS